MVWGRWSAESLSGPEAGVCFNRCLSTSTFFQDPKRAITDVALAESMVIRVSMWSV